MLPPQSAPGIPFDLVAIDMGFGHLRPAQALSDFCGGIPILLADEPPLASTSEQKKWRRARQGYELLSQAGATKIVGPLLHGLLNGITKIPHLYPRRDLSPHTMEVHILRRAADAGMGLGLATRLERHDATLLTTFFAPAILSDLHGAEKIYCVVTDSDVHRIWAPIHPEKSNIIYLAPSQRVRSRLRAYGVPVNKILVTGYPLPHELVGGPDANVLRKNLRRRLSVLDARGNFLSECRDEVTHFLGPISKPDETAVPHLVFAVGGAGAQAELVDQFLPDLAHFIRRRTIRLTLVAGLRKDVAQRFEKSIEGAGLREEEELGLVSILLEERHEDYFRAFNTLMAETDILWTKPSELSFFGALGIPLILSPPVGSHEAYNRRLVENMGAGIRQRDLRHAGQWIREMLKDGTLAGAAWTGYTRMPKFGLYRIVEQVCGAAALCDRLTDSELTHI